MLDRMGEFWHGEVSLGQLVDDLRGLYVEADPHDAKIRDGFEAMWVPIDHENELRPEPWAAPGAAGDSRLGEVLDQFSTRVRAVVSSDKSTEHC
jgi:hypothetical protein